MTPGPATNPLSGGVPRRAVIAGAATATAALALAGCSTAPGGAPVGAATLLATEHRYVDSGTAVLDVKIVGTGTPIVLVPGFARGAADFEEIMQGLAVRGRGAQGRVGRPGDSDGA